MRLTFVEDAGHYSVYTDADGDDVLLLNGSTITAHGTRQRLIPEGELDQVILYDLAQEFFRGWTRRYQPSVSRVQEFVASRLADPDEADDVWMCSRGTCRTVGLNDDDGYYGLADGSIICEDCRENYWLCFHCEELHESTTTIGDEEVCPDCRDRLYSYCDECEEYYRDGYGCGNDHMGAAEEGTCCEAPEQEFTVRNDGDPPLANDTRVTVTMPAGIISEAGLDEIRYRLHMARLYGASNLVAEVGPQWQGKRGNFTKRLSSALHKSPYDETIPPDVLSAIGNIARDHSRPVDFQIEVTRDLNLPREDFYHDGSCWWTDYASSRCTLKTNGGFGLRTFGGDYDRVQGRAWVMPLKLADGVLPLADIKPQLVPTFNTMTPDAFVVFNGYGDLEGYTPARIIAHMAGMTYRKIGFSCPPMYVNSGGYLVAPEAIAHHYTDGSLHLSVDQHSNLFDREQAAIIAEQERVLTHA